MRRPRPGRGRFAAALLTVFGSVTALGVIGADSDPAGAQISGRQPGAATCAAAIDGRLSDQFESPDTPLEVDKDAVVVVAAFNPDGTDSLVVRLDLVVTTLVVADLQSRQRFSAVRTTVAVSDIARYGVGLYHVEAEAAGCTRSMWLRVVGASPIATPAGQAAVATGVLGLTLVGVGILRGRRNRSGFLLGVVGGAAAGAGALVFAQQSGWVGPTSLTLVSWVGAPGLAGGLVQRIAAMATSRPPAPPPSPAPYVPAPPSAPSRPRMSAPTDVPSTDVAVDVAPSAGGEASVAEAPTAAEPAASGATAGAPATAAPPPRDPPRSAFAHLTCPDVVVVDEVFDLVVGLAPEPLPGVVGPALVRPESSVGDYTLSIQVIADGFALDGRATWRKRLKVTADEPFPTTTLRLSAASGTQDIQARMIQALYSVDGQTMGMAVRSVAVIARAELRDGLPAESSGEPSSVIRVPTEKHAPDLTVRILRAVSESDGRLLWTFETPHDVDLPDERIVTDVGHAPDTFARQLVSGVSAKRGQPSLDAFLKGVGQAVSKQVPDEFFDLLAAVDAKVRGVPSVLLLSEEPFIPWELAVMPEPLDDDEPPFLGAQVDVGRWVLGRRRPALPPPASRTVQDLAVVSGVYDEAVWRLAEAEAEAAELEATYGAVAVDAREAAVLACCGGQPAADLLHFAVHGVYQPSELLEGLILVDGTTLDPMTVRGLELDSGPFVFLNACQVGNGNQVLGDYAGLAEAFLHAGASGAIAPLWSIDDAAAKELALRFYKKTLVDGERVARVIRDERRRTRRAGRDASATSLAYQFFGHPDMRLSREPTVTP